MIISGAPIPSSGDVASGATDSGNPVKVGGKYNATLPTLTDGQRGDVQVDIKSIAMVNMQLNAGSNTRVQMASANALSDGAGSGLGAVGVDIFNGTTWDRQRSNVAATGLASAARTASTQTADQTNYNGRGAQVILDVTATPNDAQTLQITIEAKDPVTSKYVQMAAFTALVASAIGATATTATYIYTVYPGAAETIAAAAHELQALPLPRTWRVNVLHSSSGSWTYSVGITNLV